MKHIFTLLLLASAFTGVQAQTEGVQVNPENTLAIPVDNLNICPWMADFTVSFTIDCDAIQPDTLTSLLSLRSREWDGTDKEYRGTLWVEYDGKTGMLSFNRRYFNGVVEDNADIELEGRHTISIVHSSESEAYVTGVTDRYEKKISIYVDDKMMYESLGRGGSGDLWWRETSYFLIGDEVADAMSYNGTVYDFKYYDRPLTESEIKEYWNASYNEGGELPEHLKLYVSAENGSLNSSNSSVLPMLADYRSDAFKPEEHTRPDTYLPVLSRDSVNYISCITEGFFDFWASGMAKIEPSAECDTLWTGGVGWGSPYNNISISRDNAVITVNGGKDIIYNLDLEVGDEVDYVNLYNAGTLEGPYHVADVYYADGRKNVVFEEIGSYGDIGNERYFVHPEYYPEGAEYSAYIWQNLRFIEGVYPLPAGDCTFIRSVKYGSDVAYLNPVFDSVTSEVDTRGKGSVETISSDKAPYSLLSTVACDRLVINGSGISSVSVVSPAGAVMPCVLAGDNTVDVSALARGIYLLRVCGTEGVQTLKFVKE